MLVPHFHFGGLCQEAIHLYEKVFDTKADIIYYNEQKTCIDHAEMHIHGQRVMLNDRHANDSGANPAIMMVVVFKTKEQLMKSYDEIQEGIQTTIDSLQAVSYCLLLTTFVDRFGITWCFMVDENAEG